ncbi:MAG: queuine tRNA-ribosyltransferase [Patescibacteria group bacterium]|nr:queuine tRNA-ribosyltransferase [Patescibacteria group bacterium]
MKEEVKEKEGALLSKTDRLRFDIVKRSKEATLARAGVIHTPHGDVETPAFIPVGTKATVKSLYVDMIKGIGSEAVLANTYHLYLQPGQEIVKRHGGFANMMNWKSNNSLLPTFTDSGGFQVFSLGAAFDTGVSKIATSESLSQKQKEILDDTGKKKIKSSNNQMAKIDDDGVTFKSYIDGSSHRFTPETSVQIQHDLGADIFFAFDECTSPLASKDYQISAMNRTHHWAKRCIDEHERLGLSAATGARQAIFAVVQGGAYEDLRKESATVLSCMDFDGFGIGGSFTKEDMHKTVRSVTENLPEGKPRHLLGIGEPIDFFIGVEYGIDTFDCVSPTRIARHGNIYSKEGRINILNSKYKNDMSPICDDQDCPAHDYTKSYLAHLYRSEEILASSIASAHNLHFIIKLVKNIRNSILEDKFFEYKKEFLEQYYISK